MVTSPEFYWRKSCVIIRAKGPAECGAEAQSETNNNTDGISRERKRAVFFWQVSPPNVWLGLIMR